MPSMNVRVLHFRPDLCKIYLNLVGVPGSRSAKFSEQPHCIPFHASHPVVVVQLANLLVYFIFSPWTNRDLVDLLMHVDETCIFDL